MNIKIILVIFLILLCIFLVYIRQKDHFESNIFYDVYVLYVPSRYEYISNMLNKVFNNIIYYKGPDKNTFNKEQLIKEGKISSSYTLYNNGRYACYLGHYNIWNKFLNSDKKYALIFEDDIYFDNNSDSNLEIKSKLLNILNNIPKDADIVYVDYCYETCNNVQELFYKSNKPLCNHCYILSQKGAIKLIDKLKIMTHNKDEMMKDLIINKELISYSVNKDYINIKQDRTNFKSNLNNNNTHPKCSKILN